MFGSKLSMLKYLKCFHSLASLRMGPGKPRVLGILWVGAGEREAHRGGGTRHAACKCPVPKRLCYIYGPISSREQILSTY